ncbi:MAG TPA: response regulator transcription factor [Patescibacteria group bacterium]|nr:response regulator transcription factor [Patescibacteria group bacterium]
MKVLAVENNAELLKLLSHLLEKEGFNVYTATGGSEALRILEREKPEIACLDVLLDDMSGIEVCRHIRKNDAMMPIVLITSKSRQADISEGMAAGATEYIVKPFDLMGITQLMHRMAQACLARQNPDGLQKSFGFGSLQVFPQRLLALREGNEIALSLRETALLQFFHANAGRSLSPEALAPYSWHAQGSVDAKAVQWQIGQLRKKIETDPLDPQLLRSDDTGYVFG